ncbi:MAG: argininosuccinate synthase [Acidimicrobiaceae bacterium]|nr:argininosuccinate synthase [Acidimicrobiaceae bacterium]
MSKGRVVLAYSGGLDTSVSVKWISEVHDLEVIALAVDVGQGEDFDVIRNRALAAGAVEAEVVDAKDEFARDFIIPALFANAMYENKYPLVSALSRPVITKHLVEASKRYGAKTVAHGCTGKGNDQVRFEVSIRALRPDLEILAPVRTWGLSREDSIEYAARHNIPIMATKEKVYSIDQNLWGRAIEAGEMEDPWFKPPVGIYQTTVQTATEPSSLVISFESGIPTALNGRTMGLVELISDISQMVGAYGFGRIDMVENRRVGIKSREVYEAPGALALIMAHSDLEDLTLERDLSHEKLRLGPRWTELVYDGLWYSPLKQAIDSFMVYTQKYVTGDVRLSLEPGRVMVEGRRSPVGLYDYELATYDPADAFRHQDAEGFVRLWGLGVQTWSRKQLGTD